MVINFGPLPLKISDAKRENSGPDFGQLPDLTANSVGMKPHVFNRKTALKAIVTPLGGDDLVYFHSRKRDKFTGWPWNFSLCKFVEYRQDIGQSRAVFNCWSVVFCRARFF